MSMAILFFQNLPQETKNMKTSADPDLIKVISCSTIKFELDSKPAHNIRGFESKKSLLFSAFKSFSS